ncbi:PR domain zinc finger protein 5-like [Chironomus tepperi]|uniref:PR domain zinc finger protein 5-like n=1 Tax=Chironomus tepperi TaxID=113505 RepID=UPI00391F5568
MDTHMIHHKIKAEWTRSCTSETQGESTIKYVKSEKIEKNTKSGKIKILEQIVLRPSHEEPLKSSNNNDIKVEVISKKTTSKKTEDSKSRKCQICEKSFPVSHFEEHVKSHSLFECTEQDCDKKFKRKSSLRKHMYIHKGKFKYLCEDCKETFIDKCKYQIHIASKHKKIDKMYECKECEKTFTSADYLRKHQITHKDEYPYPCTVCNQKFKWLTSLQAHNMIHTQNKTMVQCKDCFKRFFNQRTLERHMNIHKNIKYNCKICNSVVSNRKDNIMRHIRHLHTNIPRNEVSNHVVTVEDSNKVQETVNDNQEIDEIEITDDDVSNDLIIDESVQEEPEQEVILDIQPQSVINNRVNVIQSIGNPNKNQIHQQAPQSITKSNVEKSIDNNETEKTTSTTSHVINDISNHNQSDKIDTEIPLPPKKKAIAKYNPIEHYRKILGLSETNTSSTSKESEESSEPVFPDHWRKRTSQNFLFRR